RKQSAVGRMDRWMRAPDDSPLNPWKVIQKRTIQVFQAFRNRPGTCAGTPTQLIQWQRMKVLFFCRLIS
ncbi:MAG TPA: hypothetical protein VK670_03280, partial [Silvibacterium sp.]|nr:hypothetical protein [Silvibacterium sp.]